MTWEIGFSGLFDDAIFAGARDMTVFEEAVAAVIAALEPGEVVTYGEVAAEAGFPGAARAVGTLLRTSGADLPWWRVVGAGGRIRTPEPQRQIRLLIDEGVLIVDERVALIDR